ncbi:MAG: LacI family DNA-binding transcriptional regulator [Bacteroidota bacterium]
MANIKDLAEKTGLSVATVSRVFNDIDKVSPKTRALVLKIAKELNFRPNKMASALRSGKSKTIGVVVPVIDRDVFSAAIKSMEEVFREAGYHIIIAQSHESHEKEIEIIENLKQLRVDGIIISVSKKTQAIEALEQAKKEGIGIVLFDRTLEMASTNSIIINNFKGAVQATEHLLAEGCKRIIHLAGNEAVSIFKERKRGFELAMQEAGIKTDTHSIIDFDDGKLTGLALLKEQMSGDAPPDGIFAHGDISALVAIQLLRDMKLRIPQDVAIVGFGESSFCPYVEPALTSISQRSEDVGKLAAEIMLKELQTKNKDELVYSQQMLAPHLMIRQSSQRKQDQ